MIDNLALELKSFFAGRIPQYLIILGSGLGALAKEITEPKTCSYQSLGLPQSTVSGHSGQLIAGRLENKDVVCMQGRFHLYEGYAPEIIKNTICAFRRCGVQNLIVTNAAGSLNPEMPAGSLMLIGDHINLSGQNPLIGPNNDAFGPRFPDISNAYDVSLRQKIKTIAKQANIKLFEGVYLMVSGPNFETAAEIRAFKTLGADAVGMSTVPEVISAVYAGMKVLGFSVITNLGTGLQSEKQTHDETLKNAAQASQKLSDLIKLYLKGE